MVQIIEENRRPSKSQMFGNAFANIGNAVGRSIVGHQEQKQNQDQRDRENAQAREMGFNIDNIFNPQMRQKMFEHAMNKDVQNMKNSQEEKNLSKKFENESNLLEKKYQFEEKLQGNKPKGTSELKLEKEIEDEGRVRNTAQTSFNSLARILNKKNVGKGSGVLGSLFGGETLRDTGEFQSATGGLEAMLVDMVSRGTLSNTRFNYITENLLPKFTDRQEVIRGKLKGLADLLDLDPSSLIGQESEGQDFGNKTLDAEAIKKIRKLSGNDKNEAKRIAKKMGYKI